MTPVDTSEKGTAAQDGSIDRAELKAEIIKKRGYWHPFHEGLLQWDPAYLRAYLNFHDAPWKSGHLELKVREFIYIAVDGAVSHLYDTGLRKHMVGALKAGASKEELLQVIQITTAIAHNTHELAMPMLVAELKKTRPGIEEEIANLNAEEKRKKDDFIAATGYWPECGDAMLKFAPSFVEGFLGYRERAWNSGPLEAKIKEFISLAVCASPSLLYKDGVRFHIGRALKYGATPEEISDVLQLASAIAIHTCTHSVPALIDALAEVAKDTSIAVS